MKEKVYAQVYSMIRTFPEGLIEALKLFSATGYDGVELVGDNTDELDPDSFLKLLQDLKLKVISVHSIRGEDDLHFAKKMGAKYMNVSLSPEYITREALITACEELNEKGRIYASHGIKAVLHNHADEFRWVENEEGKTRIYDLLLEYTDPKLLGFEFDVGWATLAGIDVVDYMKRYPGRFPLIHVKECTKVAKTQEEMEHFPKRIFHEGLKKDAQTGIPILTEAMKQDLYESRNWNGALGKGIIDWAALVEAADAQGCEAYISEREYYHYPKSDGTNQDCVRLDYEYLRSL